MKNQIQRIFFIFIGLMFLFVVLFSLFGTRDGKIDLTAVDFSTNNSSSLFFKNMRSYFYDKEERLDANFELFRIGTREKDTLSNKLSFVLVNNWLMDKCYIRAESKFDSLSVRWVHDDESGSFSLKGNNSYDHYEFSAKLFEQLDRKAEVTLASKNGAILFSEEEKSSLKTSLKDYFKLVGKLR